MVAFRGFCQNAYIFFYFYGFFLQTVSVQVIIVVVGSNDFLSRLLLFRYDEPAELDLTITIRKLAFISTVSCKLSMTTFVKISIYSLTFLRIFYYVLILANA